MDSRLTAPDSFPPESTGEEARRQETQTVPQVLTTSTLGTMPIDSNPLDLAIEIPSPPIVNILVNEGEPEPDLHRDIESGESDEDDYNPSCCIKFTYIIPAMPNVFMETADLAMSLKASKTTATSVIVTGAIAAGISSVLPGVWEAKDTIKDGHYLITQGRSPRDWPKLSTGQKAIALTPTILYASYSAFSESTQAYFFMASIPTDWNFNPDELAWKGFSGGVGAGVGIVTLPSETIDMYNLIGNRMTGKSEPYQNTFSRFASPFLGGVILGPLNTFQNTVQSYVAIRYVFSVEGLDGKIGIGVPSLVHAVPKLFSNGASSITMLDEFFGYLGHFKFEPKKITAFTLSTAIAVYVALLKRTLNKDFYQTVISDFQDFGLDPQSVTDQFYDALSWTIFVEESIRLSGTMYHPMYYLLDRAQYRVTSWCSKAYNYFCSPKPDHQNDESRRPLLDDMDERDNDTRVEEKGGTIESLLPSLREEQRDILVLINENESTQPASTRVSDHPSTLFTSIQTERTEEAPEPLPAPEKSKWCVLI